MAEPWDADTPVGQTEPEGRPAVPGSGVFVPAPGAAQREQREQRGEVRDETKVDISVAGEAREGRKEVRESAKGLRDAYEKQEPVQAYYVSLPAYSTMLEVASGKPSKSGDNMLVTLFSKVKDPTTGVLTAEFEVSKNVQPLLEKYKADLKGIYDPETGMFNSPRARQQFIQTTHALIAERRRAYDAMRDNYSRIAAAPEYGVRPEIVVGSDFGTRYLKEIEDRWAKVFPESVPKRVEGLPHANSAPQGELADAAIGYDAAIAEADGLLRGGADKATILEAMKRNRLNPVEGELDAALEWRAANPGRAGELSFNPPKIEEVDGGLLEPITGAARSTPEIEALPDWAGMPEMSDPSMAGVKAGLGTMASDPAETVAIIRANFPDVQARQDAKGNYILKSRDGQEYAIKPGFRASDIPRAAGLIGAFTPAARAGSVTGAAIGAAATQAGIEGTQAAAGGTFDSDQVLIAGAGGGAGKLLEKAIPATVAAVKARMPGRLSAAAPESPPPAASPAATPVSPSPAGVPAAAPAGDAERASVRKLITQASTGGGKGAAARLKLAEMAQVDQEARAAAVKLGIDVPADVFADNTMIREAIGMTRAVAGSEASAGWRDAISKAVDQADNVMRDFDAAFIEGTPAPGLTSEKVKASLLATRASLERQAKKSYEAIDEQIPKQLNIELPNLSATLAEITSEVGEKGITTAERRLLALTKDAGATYGRLAREKALIGKALANKQSPYGSMEEGALKRLYGALAEDQLTIAEEVGGEELRQQLRGANFIYAKERALGKRIVTAFGNDFEGSIASKMVLAIREGARGDTGGFKRLLKTVPEELRKETVATAIATASRSNRGAERGGFGFDEFAALYPKMRANPEIYKAVRETLGPESDEVLRNLFVVSKRISAARANVPTTGKANQGLIATGPEGLANEVLRSAAAGRAAAGAVSFVPGGGFIAPDVAKLVTGAGKDTMEKAAKMFSSPEFQGLLANGGEKAVKRFAFSSPFRAFADKIGVRRDNLVTWVKSAMAAGANIDASKPQATVGITIPEGP